MEYSTFNLKLIFEKAKDIMAHFRSELLHFEKDKFLLAARMMASIFLSIDISNGIIEELVIIPDDRLPVMPFELMLSKTHNSKTRH